MMIPNSKLLNFSPLSQIRVACCDSEIILDNESLRHLTGLFIYEVRPLRISIHQAVKYHTGDRFRSHCYYFYAVNINVYGNLIGASNKRSVHSVCTHFSVRLLPCGEPIRAGTSVSLCISKREKTREQWEGFSWNVTL